MFGELEGWVVFETFLRSRLVMEQGFPILDCPHPEEVKEVFRV